MVNHQEFRDSLAREMKARIKQRNKDLQENNRELKDYENSDWPENIKEVLKDVASQKKKKIIEVFETDIAEMKSRPWYAEAKASHIATIKAKKELDLSKQAYEAKKKEYTQKYNEYMGIESDWDIPSELIEYRKMWEKNIGDIDEETKDKIIRASKEINVKVNEDEDGSRIITLKVWDNTYHILDSNLKNHSNAWYTMHENSQSITNLDKDYALPEWIWDPEYIGGWNNKKLATYVEKKESEWWEIPSLYTLYDHILPSLWQLANIGKTSDQMAMLMYLTGMDWSYYIIGNYGYFKRLLLTSLSRGVARSEYGWGASLFMLKGWRYNFR